jgi:predicted PurR-regulated permease PerM
MKIPLYAKFALIFISAFAIIFTLRIGRSIVIPIVFASILAILLNPIVNFLLRKKIRKIPAITIAVMIALAAVLGFIYIVASQISMISETYPMLKVKFNSSSAALVNWSSEKFNINAASINQWINDTEQENINNFPIGEKISAIGRLFLTIVILPVYLFMILYYKPLLLEFIRRLFSIRHHLAVAEVLNSIKIIIQSYLVGLFFELVIVAVLNSVGLLILGINYAIILGITGAILNIIPYIGGVVAIALPMIIAFVTKDSMSYPLLVMIVYLVIQFIDNHFIVPTIFASRVQINALMSVIVVLIGGLIWGIPGMFLSIPLTAIIKVIFDHIDAMKPWGFLLGNIVPTRSGFSLFKQKNRMKAV